MTVAKALGFNPPAVAGRHSWQARNELAGHPNGSSGLRVGMQRPQVPGTGG
ncbi:MAG: hypothetical protein ACRDJ4_06885 [Actinomycetota bacterium]